MNNSISKNSITEEYPYHVVEFINIGRKPKIRKTDIVATKWISVDTLKKKCSSKYPPPPYNDESLQMFDEALHKLSDAPDDWVNYTVRLRGRAKTLHEAMLKLNKLKEELSVLTADTDESCSEVEKRAVDMIRRNKLIAEADLLLTKSSMKPSTVNDNNIMSKRNALSFPPVTKTNNENVLHDVSNLNKPLSLSQSYLTSQQIVAVNSQDKNSSNFMNSYKPFNIQNENMNNAWQQKVLETLTQLKLELVEMKIEIKNLVQEHQNLKSMFINALQIKKEFIGSTQQIANKFNYNIPFLTAEEFNRFNVQLSIDRELYEAVSTVLQTAIDASLVLTKCYLNMLKLFLTKKVAVQFVAKKSILDKHKMKGTPFCNLMELIIKERRLINSLPTNDKELTTALSTVLSNAKSWYISKVPTLDIDMINASKCIAQNCTNTTIEKTNKFALDETELSAAEEIENIMDVSQENIKIIAIETINHPTKIRKLNTEYDEMYEDLAYYQNSNNKSEEIINLETTKQFTEKDYLEDF